MQCNPFHIYEYLTKRSDALESQQDLVNARSRESCRIALKFGKRLCSTAVNALVTRGLYKLPAPSRLREKPGRRQALILTNSNIFVQGNAIESVVRKLAAILYWPQCVNFMYDSLCFVVKTQVVWLSCFFVCFLKQVSPIYIYIHIYIYIYGTHT